MNIKFKCPTCSKAYEVEERLVGKTFICPECKDEVKVPGKPMPLPPMPAQKPRSHRDDSTLRKSGGWMEALNEVVRVFILLFGFLLFAAGTMASSSATRAGAAVDGTYNIGLLNERTNNVIFNSGLAISGLLIIIAVRPFGRKD